VGKGTLKDIYEGQDWRAFGLSYADVDYSDDMKQIYRSVKDLTIGDQEKYIALQMQAFNNNYDERSLSICFQKLLERVQQVIAEHEITKVFLTSDILEYNTSTKTPIWEIFFKFILQSGIQWVTTSDSNLSHLWQKDIGAQIIINQLFIFNFDFFLSHGDISGTKDIKILRQRLGRPTEEIHCEKQEVPPVIPPTEHEPPKGVPLGNSEKIKSVTTSPPNKLVKKRVVFSLVWLPIFVVLFIMAITGATPMRIVSIFSMILLAGELTYLALKT